MRQEERFILGDTAEAAQPTSACLWRIDRFDLIFYNARHKRWQFFAEDPTATELGPRAEGEGLHRYQIRSLLGVFRRAVQSALSQSPAPVRSLFEMRSYAKEAGDGRIALARRDFAGRSDYERIYLDYLITTGWYDGVPDSHRQDLQRWFNNPTERVSREAALTFLSLLPIFEDWDTWGCFVRNRNGSASSTDDSFPPAASSDWPDPLYVVELDFRSHESLPGVMTRSEQLLGYPVSIEGLSLNLAAETLVPSPSPRTDFFDARYCQCPVGDEVIPYLFYAALVDPIMKGLVGEPEQRQFVIAYPVATAGRLHFLQVALSPSSQSADSCVEALWRDWLAIHSALWRPTFRGFLQEEIHRITASAFQSEVHDKFTEEIKKDGKVSPQHYADALYAHIYHLSPIQAVTTDHAAWHYAPYRFPKKEWNHPLYDPDRLLLVGSEWRAYQQGEERQTQPASAGRTINVAGAEVTIGSTSSDTINGLVEDHRIRQAIEQQSQFLDWLPEGLHKTKLDAENDRQLCLRIVVEHGRRVLAERGEQAFEPNSTDFRRLIDGPIDFAALTPGVKGPDGREPFESRYHPKSFGRYLAQAFKERDVSRQLASLTRILRPPLLLQLSEYFETGPAKVASHKSFDKLFRSKKVVDLREALTEHYAPLYAAIHEAVDRDPLLKQAVKPSPTLNGFHQHLETRVNQVKAVQDLFENGGRLPTEHRSIRIEHLGTYAEWSTRSQHGFRCYWLDPMVVLHPFFKTLRSLASGYLPKGLYVRKLRGECSYTNRWMPDNGHPVRLLEHFISFGMCTPCDKETFKDGELAQQWTNSQQAVAGLLLHTRDSTHVFVDQHFIPDAVLHQKLRGDDVATTLFEAGAQACLVITLQIWRTVESDSVHNNWTAAYSNEFELS